jgi:prevent-host-death family protein
MWTVQEAKSKLSEVLERARKGEAQVIGTRDPCVVISMGEYQRLGGQQDEPHLGRWLVENAPRGFELELPPRGDDRPDPFAWFDDLTAPAARRSRRARDAKTGGKGRA